MVVVYRHLKIIHGYPFHNLFVVSSVHTSVDKFIT
jgi:hypothetical protein